MAMDGQSLANAVAKGFGCLLFMVAVVALVIGGIVGGLIVYFMN
jgi:glycerol uptake facilitator-like aquaporin